MRWVEEKVAAWLSGRGYVVLGRCPVGVVLSGNCVAVGDRETMRVYNPSRKIVVLTGSQFVETEAGA